MAWRWWWRASDGKVSHHPGRWRVDTSHCARAMLPVAPAALRRQASAIGPLRSLDCPGSGSPPWLAGPRAGSDCAPGHSRATAPGVPAPLRQRPGWRASVVAIANRPCAHSLPTHVPGQAHGRPGKRSPRLRRQAVRPGAHAWRAVPGSGHTAGEPTTAMGRKPSTKKNRRVARDRTTTSKVAATAAGRVGWLVQGPSPGPDRLWRPVRNRSGA